MRHSETRIEGPTNILYLRQDYDVIDDGCFVTTEHQNQDYYGQLLDFERVRDDVLFEAMRSGGAVIGNVVRETDGTITGFTMSGEQGQDKLGAVLRDSEGKITDITVSVDASGIGGATEEMRRVQMRKAAGWLGIHAIGSVGWFSIMGFDIAGGNDMSGVVISGVFGAVNLCYGIVRTQDIIRLSRQ